MNSHTSVLKTISAQCGLRPGKKRRSYRIVGGQQVQKHSWPWQVSFVFCMFVLTRIYTPKLTLASLSGVTASL